MDDSIDAQLRAVSLEPSPGPEASSNASAPPEVSARLSPIKKSDVRWDFPGMSCFSATSLEELGPNGEVITNSCQDVFELPELLESILLCLPLKEILAAARVSTRFLDTICNSPAILQALFMQPSGKPQQHWIVDTGDPIQGVRRKESYQIIRLKRSKSVTGMGTNFATKNNVVWRPIVPNSLLFKAFGTRCPFASSILPLGTATLVVDVDWKQLRSYSSCNCMLITSHPVGVARLTWYENRGSFNDPELEVEVRNSTGITFGDLFNEESKHAGTGLILCTVSLGRHLAVPQSLLAKVSWEGIFKPPFLQPTALADEGQNIIPNIIEYLTDAELRPLRLVCRGLCAYVDQTMTEREPVLGADLFRVEELSSQQLSPLQRSQMESVEPQPKDIIYFYFMDDEDGKRVAGAAPSTDLMSPGKHPDTWKKGTKLNEAVCRRISDPFAPETIITLSSLALHSHQLALRAQICKPSAHYAEIHYTDEIGQQRKQVFFKPDGLRKEDLANLLAGNDMVDTHIRLIDVMLPGNDHWAWEMWR